MMGKCDAAPVIGNRPITDITPELLKALRRVEAQKRYGTAGCLRSICRQVSRYATATDRAAFSLFGSGVDHPQQA